MWYLMDASTGILAAPVGGITCLQGAQLSGHPDINYARPDPHCRQHTPWVLFGAECLPVLQSPPELSKCLWAVSEGSSQDRPQPAVPLKHLSIKLRMRACCHPSMNPEFLWKVNKPSPWFFIFFWELLIWSLPKILIFVEIWLTENRTPILSVEFDELW
jgi:hypothetical protein